MSLSDSNLLGTNVTFQARVQSALLTAAIAIFAEGLSVNNHRDRVSLVHAILANPTALTNYGNLFALAVSTDTTVEGQATVSNTVVLTAANVAAQEALVTDAAINTAVSAMYNAFANGIAA